ncbi:carboxypeptidase-like regulatory domain-containing protein, partial [Deinococcus sp.]|uniref:carboxypeptidase-like regulatory domain-containing protein n=1 Tax=Deinococcus sp. TaxID=47478 RepID=UPI002869876D
AQVRPGAYQVQLGDGVDAQYTLAAMKAVTVPLKGMVSVLVAVQQTAILQGQLRDDSGQPLAGVPVSVNGPDGAQSVVTDAEGRYRVSGLGFGAYTVAPQPDAAYYALPEPSAVRLDGAHALVTTDLVARAIVDARGLDTSGMEVTVTVPQTPLPPGVAVPVVVQVTPEAERVTVDDPQVTLTRVAGSDEWRGMVQIPAGQQGPLEVQVTAWKGAGSTSERAILLVDPSLKSSDLSLRPFNALPDQVVQLRATVYGVARRVTVRDESGRTILLTADGEHGYFADVQASPLPGAHTLTLMIDDQPATQAQYKVIGRP